MLIKLPEQLENQLEELSREAGKSKDDYTYNVIVSHLEDMHDTKSVKSELEDINSGKIKTKPLKELLEKHDF